ncbi:MAG: hypothetical protein B7Z52_06115, partial [Burkholderiales bacterium 12-64-5]
MALAAALAGDRPFTAMLHRISKPDGSLVVLETSGAPSCSADGAWIGMHGVTRDITPSWVSLGGRIMQLEAIYQTAPVALCLIDRDRRYVTVNQEMARICRAPAEQIPGKQIEDFIPEAGDALTGHIQALDAGGSVPDHEVFWNDQCFQISLKPVHDVGGTVRGVTVALVDITERKRIEQLLSDAVEQLKIFAQQDFLTGLPNRRHFEDIFTREALAARRSGTPLSVLLVDVDHFKPYNDQYGHPAGDDCLRRVAAAIKQALKHPRHRICRYGGEELVAIHHTPLGIEDRQDAVPAQVRAGRIAFDAVSFHYPGHELPLYDGLSLTIEGGERVGLVGHSGSGKT